jgi:glycine betaine/choline ABC-type transport system substrate-binding protein
VKRKMSKVMVMVLLVACISIVFVGCGSNDNEINIAAQNVNETVILAHMAKILVEENTDATVNINTEFQGSSVLHQAMLNEEIDIYPTWTGTQLTGVLRYEGPNLTAEETYQRVKDGFEEEFNMTWGEPLGFNNTYVFTITDAIAEEYNLKKASDLAPYAEDWILAGDENFDTRSDAYPGWSEAYDIEFKEVVPMQYGVMYTALDNNEVQVAAAYSTDSRIAKLNLVMLEDDKEFFPDYSGAYVISQSFLEDNTEVLDIVNKLGGMIETAEMAALNLRFDEGEEPDVIANDFLKEKGLI